MNGFTWRGPRPIEPVKPSPATPDPDPYNTRWLREQLAEARALVGAAELARREDQQLIGSLTRRLEEATVRVEGSCPHVALVAGLRVQLAAMQEVLVAYQAADEARDRVAPRGSSFSPRRSGGMP